MNARRTICCLVAVSCAIGAPAWGQHVVKNPNWLKKPTDDTLLAVFPAAAVAKGVTGKAKIHCTVTVLGALRDCTVKSETPPGLGFGAAALALTPQFQMTPETIDGVATESDVIIPIDWPLMPSEPSTATGSRISRRALTGRMILSQVSWFDAPTLAQVAAAYPAKARSARADGLVSLDCAFARDGRLTDCEVLQEAPRGYDFGRAARVLARDFAGPTKLQDGQSTQGDRTQLVVAFSPSLLDTKAPTIGMPHWTRIPEAADLAKAFPTTEQVAQVDTAHVMLACDVAAGGSLENCAVESETPSGVGFGKAALAISGKFQVSVWTDEGLPTVGGRVNVPIRYQFKDPAPASPPKP